MAGPTVVAQLSDVHVVEEGQLLLGRIDTITYLQAAVEHLATLEPRPDLVLVTGDLTGDGRPEEYEQLAKLLAGVPSPMLLIPGNHDDTAAMATVLTPPTSAVAVPRSLGWQAVVDVGPLRVVGLDSTLPGSPSGRLGPERLTWLDDVLAASTAPTIVAVHHPPFATGIGHMDTMALEDADAFGDVIARHPHVVRVVVGHVHRAITTGWRGTVVTIAPSGAHQVALDLGDGLARWRREPPGVLLHVWLPGDGDLGGSLVTHLSPIGDYGPTEDF
jgi:Icc protein